MLKLSDEALGAVMLALQNSLMEQSDIVPVLKGFNFKANEIGQLFVMNPPLIKFKEEPDDPMFIKLDDHPIDSGTD